MDIAICDDNQDMIQELTCKLQRFFEKQSLPCSIASFTDAAALLQSARPFDLLLLDIQMEGLSGLQAARELRRMGFTGFIIFITVLQEYVYDAFDVDASGYLLKPIDDARFEHTLERVQAVLRAKAKNLILQRGNLCRVIPFDDIVYGEAENRKVCLHLCPGGTSDYSGKLEDLQHELDSRFFRCHRSYLVHLKYVRTYRDGLALLSNGEQIMVSRLRGREFSQAVLHYMKEGGLS